MKIDDKDIEIRLVEANKAVNEPKEEEYHSNSECPNKTESQSWCRLCRLEHISIELKIND